MLHHYADDGRILTPPKELEPMLKDSFPAFSKLLGHIRFFYMADEIWDGKSSLIFDATDSNTRSRDIALTNSTSAPTRSIFDGNSFKNDKSVSIIISFMFAPFIST